MGYKFARQPQRGGSAAPSPKTASSQAGKARHHPHPGAEQAVSMPSKVRRLNIKLFPLPFLPRLVESHPSFHPLRTAAFSFG